MPTPKGGVGTERPIKEITKDIKKLVEELEKTVKAQEHAHSEKDDKPKENPC